MRRFKIVQFGIHEVWNYLNFATLAKSAFIGLFGLLLQRKRDI